MTIRGDDVGSTEVAYLMSASRGAPYFAQQCTIHSYPRHRRVDYLDIIAVVAGGGHFVKFLPSGDTRVTSMKPGEMFIFRPSDEIRLVGLRDIGMDVYHVAFPMSDWQAFTSLARVNPEWLLADDPPRAQFRLSGGDEIRPFRTALTGFLTYPTMYHLVAFWADVIPAFFPARDAVRADTMPTWLADAIEAMRSEENLRAGLPRLLQIAHVSRAHLYAMVRRHLGTSPSALVAVLRVRHAATLLAAGTLSVREIAAKCGFASTTYFSSTFRRVHHLSPREYRTRATALPPEG